jgi:hypothetical protein
MSGRHSQHHPRRGADRGTGSGYSALAAAAAGALLGVAGCSALTTSAIAGTGAPQPAPLTCKQQYQAWRTGPANAGGRKLDADAAAIGRADDDIPAMASDLKIVGTDAASILAYPMPKCADPAGYWPQCLNLMKAAGDNAGAASGLAALILAEVPLRQLPGIQAKLSAELKKTADVEAPLPAVQSPVPAPSLPTLALVTVPPVSVAPLPTPATVAPLSVPTAPAPVPTLPTLATVPVQTLPAPPVPTMATVAPVPTTGS